MGKNYYRSVFAYIVVPLLLVVTGCSNEREAQKPAAERLAPDLAVCESASALPVEEMTEDTPFFAPKVIEPLKPLDPQLGNVFARQHVALHGEWNYLVDQLAIGDSSPLLYGGVGRNQKASASELLEYSFDGGNTLTVPGDWNSQHPELFWYRGVVWYQKELNYEPTPGKRQFLYFGGGNYRKDVYVNGQLLARHEGGFTPFNTEITEFLQPGDNAIVVRVDSMSGPDAVPTEYNDWMNYGGLTREVLLVEVPATFIRNYKLQLQKGSRDRIGGWVQLDGDSAGKEVVLSIPGAGLEQAVSTDDSGRAVFSFSAESAAVVTAKPEVVQRQHPSR